jgi:transcriptional regulator with XRE-family HTH domain
LFKYRRKIKVNKLGQRLKVGAKIRKVRSLRRLSKENLAAELGISQKAYSKIENGSTEVTVSRLQKIADTLGISLAELLSFDDKLMFNNHNQHLVMPAILLLLYLIKSVNLTKQESNTLKKKLFFLEMLTK